MQRTGWVSLCMQQARLWSSHHATPAWSRRDHDKHLYKERHLIENFFAELKQFRCITTRYDKTARSFLGDIHLTAAVAWLS
jgi:transposase